MKIFTVGFTQKRAERFFALIDRPDILRVVDIRLNNSSQLAGFSKSDDLRYFLRRLVGKDYIHLPELAPTPEILKTYRDGKVGWAGYERDFLALMRERSVTSTVPKELLDGACLLCSEPTPERCHRRLVAEYLASCWPDVQIEHLL